MLETADITVVEAGKVFLDHGPISMVISASCRGVPLAEKCVGACEIAVLCLAELEPELQKLKQPWPRTDPETLSGIGLKMWQAVSMTGDGELTPMAAVAGAIADRVADWLTEQGATKVMVNNGGDVAIRLRAEETTSVGIVPNLSGSGFSKIVRLTAVDEVGGVATSGLGGRSFTCGIVESVTVLSQSCAVADAFATSLANASYIESPAVQRVLAKTLDPGTDISELNVTVQVDGLTLDEIKTSLDQVMAQGRKAIGKDQIKGVAVYLQGITQAYPEQLFI